MKNCPVFFFSFSSFSSPEHFELFLPNTVYSPTVCRCSCQCCPFALRKQTSGYCDFISPTSLGRLKLLLFHRLFPPAEGGCCWRCPRRCREWGAQGPLFSCREGQGGGSPRQRRAPLPRGPFPVPSPRYRVPSAGTESTRPAPSISPRPRPGASSPPKLRGNLYRDPPPPRFTPRSCLMTLNELVSLPRTWPLGGDCRAGKDGARPIKLKRGVGRGLDPGAWRAPALPLARAETPSVTGAKLRTRQLLPF